MEVAESKKPNMREVILNFPKQFKIGLKAAEDIRIRGRFSSVVACGMGGSAWPAEILRDWMSLPILFYINKTYNLPPQTNKKSLAVICSYSGNTEEALNCYQEAKKKGLKVIGLTTGGELKELCQKDELPLVLMPGDVPQPRMGCGYTFAALAGILMNSGLAENKSGEILTMAENLQPSEKEVQGKELAREILNRTPIIYTSDGLKALAYVWKIKFNENSKIQAFSNYFPELNHNELSGYAAVSNDFFIIILRDKNEHPRILKRMSLTADMIESKSVPVRIFDMEGKNTLEKIFNSIVLADWASYYLALDKGVDPLSSDIVEEFKKRMK